MMSMVKQGVRDDWLVRIAVLFAVVLELIPIEMQLLDGLYHLRSLAIVLIVKVGCLTLIFLPLVIWITIHGFAAIKDVWRRVSLIGVIVTMNLALEFFWFCRGS
jgi:hypothetical protein